MHAGLNTREQRREVRGPHFQSCIGNYLDVGQDRIRII